MNKRERMTIIMTIGIACFVLVMIMFMQFKIVYETDITSIERMREEDLQTELANWKAKYEESEKQLNEIKETMIKYKEESSSDSQTKKNLQLELEKLELMLGTTNVSGTGITITLEEEANSTKKIDSDELMIIVNYLRDAGAEAIEINGERVVDSTFFAYIGNSYIKINGKRISAPYKINVIGDPDYLKSSLVGTGGYAEKITNWGQKISFETSKKIVISKYDGKDLDIKYIKEQEKQENK